MHRKAICVMPLMILYLENCLHFHVYIIRTYTNRMNIIDSHFFLYVFFIFIALCFEVPCDTREKSELNTKNYNECHTLHIYILYTHALCTTEQLYMYINGKIIKMKIHSHNVKNGQMNTYSVSLLFSLCFFRLVVVVFLSFSLFMTLLVLVKF